MNYLGRVLKGMDYSSVSYYFHINGNESFRTKFGGLLYFCYFIFFMYFAVKLSLDFLAKLNYSIIFIEKILPTPPELSLQEYNLSFAFSVNYDNNVPLSEDVLKKYLVEKVYFVTMRNSTKKTKKEVKFKPCEKKDLYTKFNDPAINYSEFTNWRCLADRNFTIQGGFNDELFQYIEYAVFLNYTTFSNEKMTYVNNYFGKTLVNVVVKYFDMGIDVDNYDQPLRTYDYNIFDYVSISKVKKVNLDFSRYEFQNDAQILFGEGESEYFLRLGSEYGYSYDMYDRSPTVNDHDVLFKYYIRSSSNVSIVKRGYQKLWDLLANIGGLVGQILFCIVFINTFYNKFKSKEELVNNLLKFKDNYNVNKSTYNEIKKLQDDYISIISARKNSNLDECGKSNDYEANEVYRLRPRTNFDNTKDFNNHNCINNDLSRIGFDEKFVIENHPENEFSHNEKVISKSTKKNKEINNNNNKYSNKEYYVDSPYNVSSNFLLKNNISKSPNAESVLSNDLSSSNNYNSNNKNNDYNNSVKKTNLFSNLFKNKKFFEKNSDSNNAHNENSYHLDKKHYKSNDLPNSTTKLVKVETNKSITSKLHNNKEKDEVKLDNIKIEMSEPSASKPAEVIFVNKNLNLLKNSIFSNHSKFLMRKLLSIKDMTVNLDVDKDKNKDNINKCDFNPNVNNDNVQNIGLENNIESNLKDQKQLNSYRDQNLNEKSIEIKMERVNEENLGKDEEENGDVKKSTEILNSIPFDEEECDERRNDRNVVYSFAKNTNNNDNYYKRNNKLNMNEDELNCNESQQNNDEKTFIGELNTKKFSFNGLDNFMKNQEPEIVEKPEHIIKILSEQMKDIYEESNEPTIFDMDTKSKEAFKRNENFDSVSYRTNDIMLDPKPLYKTHSNEPEQIKSPIKFGNEKSTTIFKPKNFNSEKNFSVVSNYAYCKNNSNYEKEKENQNSLKTKYEDIRSNLNLEVNTVKFQLGQKPKIEAFQKQNTHLEFESKASTKENKIIKEKKIHFDFSVLDIFCKCLCLSKSKQNKFQLYKRSHKSINDNLNIYFYLKLIQEIEIIKSLVFSYEQIGLINFVAKPMIFNEVNSNMKMDANHINKIFREESSLENALEFFREIINHGKFNDVDHKLVKIFLYEFESIIDYEKKSFSLSEKS